MAWSHLPLMFFLAHLLCCGRSEQYTPMAEPSLAMKIAAAQTWPNFFQVIGRAPWFRERHWGRLPLLARAPSLADCFSVADVRAAAAAGEVLAGPNAFIAKNPVSLELAPGLPRGTPIAPDVLELGLLNGTMSINDASASWPTLFEVARSGVRQLRIPVNVNVYITHVSLETSLNYHTDRQDVFIVQCEGRKHWRVHSALVEFPAEHQEQGKSGHVIDSNKLGLPLLEATLSKGHILYVPRGFVHATTKAPLDGKDAAEADAEFSTSLTIGLQTESMGFTYDKLLLCGLFLHGQGPTLEELRELIDMHKFLRRPLPLPGSILDPGEHVVGDARPLEVAADELLAAWSTLFPKDLPLPRQRLQKAARILAQGHQFIIREYEERMLDTVVPRKFRQEVWRRRYENMFHRMLGQCGFLTRCFQRKFWLAKYTTHQRCWGKA